MASSAEQALQETTSVPNASWRSQRAEYATKAVEYMNQLASDMKAVPGKINWSGPASAAAEEKFGLYGSQVAAHADTLAAVNAADAQASAAVDKAQEDYAALPPAALTPEQTTAATQASTVSPGVPTADAQNAQLAAARAQQAEADKQKLDSAMGQADSDLRSNVSWDFGDVGGGKREDPPPTGPGTGPSGTMPSGSVPGGGGGTGNSGAVWGQGPEVGWTIKPEDGGTLIGCPGLQPPPNQTLTGPLYLGPDTTGITEWGGVTSADGPTTGVLPGADSVGGTGNFGGGGIGGVGGAAAGGSTGGLSGLGGAGVVGAGGAVAGGAGLAAGALRGGGLSGGGLSGGGLGGSSGGRSGSSVTSSRFGGAAAADGDVHGRTGAAATTSGRGAVGGAASEGGGTAVAGGSGARGGGMMGGGGGGGGGGARGGVSGASAGKYGVPKLGAEGGRGGAAGAGGTAGRGGSAGGAAGAGGRGGAGGSTEERDRDRTFLTEEDEQNWYDGIAED